ncbi:MAG TPA: hypothetical protein VF097_02060 [Actinomycetota bacterium]
MSPRERNLLIVLGVVALAAVAFFFLVVRPGGAPDETAPTLGASPSPDLSPSPEPEEEEEEEGELPRPRTPGIAFFSGRDPFMPLVEDTTTTTNGGTTTTNGDDGGTTTPPPGNGDGDDGNGGVPSEQRGESITVGGHTVTLIDILAIGRVQVEVDGQTYTVSPGETFADNFQLVSVQGGCANFRFGDQSFTLCEPGERK